MRKIGLIGGMSWESTAAYYSVINSEVNARLGKNHSSECLVYSFDFQEIEELQYASQWEELENKLIQAAKALKTAGADCIVVCANTMHKVVDNIERIVGIPLLHIVDAIGEKIQQDHNKTVGLLGTKFTMEEDFYRKRLEDKYNLKVLLPNKDDIRIINDVIFKELVKGITRDSSRNEYLRIMNQMKDGGAQGIILGCTEIGLLIKEFPLSLYDSAIIHANRAVEFSIQ